MSEGESTPTSAPSTPKSDKKPTAEEPQKISVSNAEKAADAAEKNKVQVEAQEKTVVFDELGGNPRSLYYRRDDEKLYFRD